jgi:isochorismate synthase
MNIDAAISNKTPFAILVLPAEFDATRSPIAFEYVNGRFIQPDMQIELSLAPFSSYFGNETQAATSKETHAQLIHLALQRIESRELEKVVISCIKHAPRSAQTLDAIFHKLTAHYPTAMVYALHHPDYGTWMGATPELLLHKAGNRFHTVSLAGTQAYSDTHEIQWNEKLRREQSLVTDFIVQTIEQCGGVDITMHGPYTAQAGPLAHLKTNIHFTGSTAADQYIKQLQPTPAVCGLPREPALDFLNTHSTAQRRLYAGRIGLRYPSGDEIHFVNLRCMQVFEDHFELHVGGGIVTGSIAEEEWHETEIKANVLRNLLQ